MADAAKRARVAQVRPDLSKTERLKFEATHEMVREKSAVLLAKLRAVSQAKHALLITANKFKNTEKIALRKWIQQKKIGEITTEIERQSKIITSKSMRLEKHMVRKRAWPAADTKPVKKNVLKQLKKDRKRKSGHPEEVSTVQPQVGLVFGPPVAVTPEGVLVIAPPQQPGSVPDLEDYPNPQFHLLLLAPSCEGQFGVTPGVQERFDVPPQHQKVVPIPDYQQPGPSWL